MLVGELAGKIKLLPPPYTRRTRRCSTSSPTSAPSGVQQGIYDLALDPNFATNHYYYVFYTRGTPERYDRLSRFTATADLTGTVPAARTSSIRIPQHAERGASRRRHRTSPTTARSSSPPANSSIAAGAQDLNSPRGKVHRINMDGTRPDRQPVLRRGRPELRLDLGLRPAQPVPRLLRRPDRSAVHRRRRRQRSRTSNEEVNLGARGANYGWPNFEGACPAPCTSPLYSYQHNGRDASVTGGFVYHGAQFPAGMQGNYFFADYAQNWIRRLTFNADGSVSGVFNFEPANGQVDGPYGDIVYLTEGPDGALYYLDLGYSDITGTFGVSKVRRIRYLSSNQAPVAVGLGQPDRGPVPLTVSFSQRRLERPRGSAHHLLVGLRRRHHVDGRQPQRTPTRCRARTRCG